MIFLIVIIYYIIFCLFIYSNDDNYDSNDLKYTNIYAGLEPAYEKIEGRDGNGDGTIYQRYYVEDDEKINNIISLVQKMKGWKKGIIDEDLYNLLDYGLIEKSIVGRECYYYFKDRFDYNYEVKDVYDYKESIKRNSDWIIRNYTIQILDVENRNLYLFIYDS